MYYFEEAILIELVELIRLSRDFFIK